MSRKFVRSRSSPKKTLSLLLIVIGLFLLLLWRTTRISDYANLLVNSNFQQSDLTGWQIIGEGRARAGIERSGVDPDRPVLILEIPDTAAGSWVGIGQRLRVTPLERYLFAVDYRLAYEGESSAKLIMRVSQFDQAGELIKAEEFSDPNPLKTNSSGDQGYLEWTSFSQTFVTEEQTVALELGLGLLGTQATVVEIDNLEARAFPTQLTKIWRDKSGLPTLLLLIVILGYATGRVLWPARRKVAVNTVLVLVSLVLTLMVAEIIIRIIPINFTRPNWPPGYYIAFMDGQSYRLAKNYPPALIVDSKGHQHLVMSNSLGIKDNELTSSEADLNIILVLGDSMTFGLGISDVNHTWPKQIDEEIGRLIPGPDDYHFVNAGVSGYNTFQAVSLLQALIKDMADQGVKPKIALLSFFSSHWERNLYGAEGAFAVMHDVLIGTDVKSNLLALPGHLVNQSRFDDLKRVGASRLNYPHQVLLSKSKLYFVFSALFIDFLGENSKRDLTKAPDADPAAATYQALRLFKEMAEANGIHPIVAYLPDYKLFTAAKYETNRELEDQLSVICRDLNLTFISPYANMQKLGINGENATEKLTLPRDSHYSVQGHSIYARALAPLLADHLMQFEKTSFSSSVQRGD